METNVAIKRSMAVAALASVVGLIGLATAGVALMWVAGALGISAAAASQIVDAIQAGGIALAIVMSIFGAGVIGAIIATTRAIILRAGKAAAVA